MWKSSIQFIFILNNVLGSAGDCPINGTSGFKTIFLITFDSGSNQFSNRTPAYFKFNTSHTQKLEFPVSDGEFGFVNNISVNPGNWHNGALDHTENDTNGYMFLVNVNNSDPEIFTYEIHNLSINSIYEFSAYFANIIKNDTQNNNTKPNIRFEVREEDKDGDLIASNSTGDIPEYDNMTWWKYGLSFVATSSSVVLSMTSIADWDDGNDIAIDDIELRVYSLNYSLGYSSGSADLCSQYDITNGRTLFSITFGSGSHQCSSQNSSDFNFATALRYSWNALDNGVYTFLNAVPHSWSRYHSGALDHTKNYSGGCMYAADIEEANTQIFNYEINNLCAGFSYEFSAYFANIETNSFVNSFSVLPNIRLEIRALNENGYLIASQSTGKMPRYNRMTWSKYNLSFVPTSSSIVLLMISNSEGTVGNVVAIDDIELRVLVANHSGFCSPVTTLQQPKFSCPTASWKSNGITIVNSTWIDFDLIGMFIDNKNGIYINDPQNNEVQIWHAGEDRPKIIKPSGLNNSKGIFVTNDGDIYLDNGENDGRVDKWLKNSNKSVPVMHVNGSCFGLFIDRDNNLYCSLRDKHQVGKHSLNCGINRSLTIVAGTGNAGSASNMLNAPIGIFVDEKLNLYVADYGNNRIQLFEHRNQYGRTIVANDSFGNPLLKHPTDIKLDADGNLFIVDEGNHRIVVFVSNRLHCIIGCSKTNGTVSNQLQSPFSIGFDSYGSIFVFDRGNRRIQKFPRLGNASVLYNRPKLSPCATWNENGTIVVNKTYIGNYARGIFVDSNNTLYVASHDKSQIFMVFENTTDPVVLRNVSLSIYSNIIVSTDGEIYYENGNKSGRIEKWIINSTCNIIVANFSNQCRGLFIDQNNTLYCSIHQSNQVFSVSLNEGPKTLTSVAGLGEKTVAASDLHAPWGLFVDTTFDLYVADAQNSRIQRFQSGQKNGTTVAGHGGPHKLTLYTPTDVILDADSNLFIADNDNSRIIRVIGNESQCIIGCNKSQTYSSGSLNKTFSLRFDSYGNIFVADEYNHRIVKFNLATNSCDQPTTSVTEVTTWITTTQTVPNTSTSLYNVFELLSTQPLSPVFWPERCQNTTNIGRNCNVLNDICNFYNPCQCPRGFNGTYCENDHRPCKPNTCLYHGECNETSNSTFNCTCKDGWEGDHCQSKKNYCYNVTCFNFGVCRPLLNFKCECIDDSYSGDFCEIVSTKIIIYRTVSKSLAYIAVIAMSSVVMFIIIMDILKYCFGIDPTRGDLQRIRQAKRTRKKRVCMVERLIYVDTRK